MPTKGGIHDFSPAVRCEVVDAVAYDMRNAVTHGYFAIDLDQIWTTVEVDLPTLGVRLLALLATLTPDGGPSDKY